MKKSAVLGLVALGASGCASKPPPKHIEREQVAKHYVVVVEEPDPIEGLPITRSVAGGPVSLVPTRESAFATVDPRYSVLVQWRGDCLDVTVARSGLPPYDDFAAHGCVKLDAGTSGTKPVASVTGKNGAPIQVLVWVLET